MPRVGGLGEVRVEEMGAHGLVVGSESMDPFPVRVVVEPGQLGVGQPGPGLAGRGHQYPGEVVLNQRIGPARFDGATGGDPQSGGADQFGDGPAVAGSS